MTTQNFELLKKSAVTQIASDLAQLVEQQTQAQINALSDDVKSAISASGWMPAGGFATGFTFTARNQVGFDASGNTWSYNGSLPFTVPAGTVPSAPTYTNRGDGALRSALAAPGSSVLIAGVTAAQVALAANPATTTVIVRDAYRTSVEANSGGKNTVVYDAQGNPNVMVVVPRFNYEDLNLPLLELGTGTPTAFLTNGVPRSEILIAKYLASTPSGTTGCSVIAGAQPRINVNFDAAKALCTNKGAGWHLLSRHEWAAIALWCLANGTVPRGNTFWGRSHERPWETARRADNGLPGNTSGTGSTDTGKGPATWAHNHTDFGIHDLVGNVWEWVDQFKLVDGRIICTPDNQPDLAEASWPATTAWLDASTPTGGVNILSNAVTNRVGAIGDNQNAGNFTSNTWQLTGRAAGYTPVELLRRLLVEPAVNSGLPAGNLWARNFGERLPIAGGSWGHGSDAGLSALSLRDSRSGSGGSGGFRPALFV